MAVQTQPLESPTSSGLHQARNNALRHSTVSCNQPRRPRARGDAEPARKPARPPCRVDDDPRREGSRAGQHANLVLLRQLHPIDRAGLAHLDALLMRIIEQELVEGGP